MKKRVVVKSSNTAECGKKAPIKASRYRYIRAAEGDEEDFDLTGDDVDADSIIDSIDDVADQVNDLQDTIDDMDEDEVDIAVNNNIANHYIAECERCKEVFISAVVESDHKIDNVEGICPICKKQTQQNLKWIIKDVHDL